MLDLNATLAPDMYLVMRDLRDLEAEKRQWNRRLRELLRGERASTDRSDGNAPPASLVGSRKA